MSDQEEKQTTVTLGDGQTYPAKLQVLGHGTLRLQVGRTDETDPKNFPVSISFTDKDALNLAAELCDRLAWHNRRPGTASLEIATAICLLVARKMESDDQSALTPISF